MGGVEAIAGREQAWVVRCEVESSVDDAERCGVTTRLDEGEAEIVVGFGSLGRETHRLGERIDG